VNPDIVVDGAERLIDFLVEVFGGVEQGRSQRPDGRITRQADPQLLTIPQRSNDSSAGFRHSPSRLRQLTNLSQQVAVDP
jgi:hypothetical protein